MKPDGTVVTRFTPIAPYDTPDAVENLCNAYEQAITHSSMSGSPYYMDATFRSAFNVTTDNAVLGRAMTSAVSKAEALAFM